MLPLVTVEGRVVAEPELRFSTGGMAIGRITVVASSRKKNEDTGQWEDDKTLFLDCTMFKQLAENTVESVVKGDLVTVVGRLQTEKWQDKTTGENRSKIALTADSVAVSLAFRTVPHGAGKAERSAGQRPSAGQASAAAAAQDPWATGPSSVTDDQPPF